MSVMPIIAVASEMEPLRVGQRVTVKNETCWPFTAEVLETDIELWSRFGPANELTFVVPGCYVRVVPDDPGVWPCPLLVDEENCEPIEWKPTLADLERAGQLRLL